ncbi:uncharacterized protein TRUGW13939_10410 [Talaromyces rugulosus]|uniref:FAD/NAD(P)-binding domain-containing protein n=1 Tax=Talaromyces rugulosus TaxID=121627 RepID=A0A7H8RBW8_TALRU|nr:uncharacterized protein TRUGW13939_10410 [Talaromyces rugulosus]QKX63241.1 hypothetical protein TRUGW13939_10410 [Talaromyces rugulosus]
MNGANSSGLSNCPKTPAPFPTNWIPVLEKLAFSPHKIDFVCIGAGFSGLTLAYRWKHEGANEFINRRISEKNHDVGGTWLENRYPGNACDVPAHIYTFTFEPNPDWTSFYASGREIWQYMKRTTEKYQLDERVRLNSRVTSAIWDDAAARWKIRVDQGGKIIETEAHILINGSGILNKWHWPDIKGLSSFRGKLVLSADWDESLDWEDKRPEASKIATYIRSPTWITFNFAAQLTSDGENFEYPENDKRLWRENLGEHSKLRRHFEHEFNKFFPSYLAEGAQQAEMNKLFRQTMEQRLNHNADLCAKLIPDFGIGCRRICPGDGYLEALQEKNVRIEFCSVEEITPTGIRSCQGHEEFDIVVCATGFDVSFVPPWEMIGKNGVSLREQWKDAPYAYFGICTPNMPNYFIYNGPNCPIAHGSLILVIEWFTD